MEHRGACSADQISGDGAGIMTQIPWDLFKQDLPDLNEQDTGYVGFKHVFILHLQLFHQHQGMKFVLQAADAVNGIEISFGVYHLVCVI